MDPLQTNNLQTSPPSNRSTMARDPIIRTVATCPSPIILLFYNSHIVHLTLDSGAELYPNR